MFSYNYSSIFFVFMDVISWDTMPGWEETASWVGRVCLIIMKTIFSLAFIQVLNMSMELCDCWLSSRESCYRGLHCPFSYLPFARLCVGLIAGTWLVVLCASVFSFPHLPAQISEAEITLPLCLLQGIGAQVADGSCPFPAAPSGVTAVITRNKHLLE